MLSHTYHGGRLDEAMRAFPQAPRPWLDLSTGINPCAWNGDAAVPDLARLPLPGETLALERAAARAFGLAHGAVAALPGSEIGLRLLAHIGLPAPFHIVTPGYRTHGEALPGAVPIPVEALETAAEAGGTLLLANPNNPDGRLIVPDRLIALARRMGGRGGVLVVDEAFADVLPGASTLPLLGPDDPMLVLRSFGKFFGLAGVRLGFACGAPALVGRLAALLGSWPASATAIALGTAAYADAGWHAATRVRLSAAADALDAVLRGHGMMPEGACPLFRLIQVADAAALFAHLARAGILTRPFDYAPTWLRFGLPPDRAALARLDEALRHR